jgi:hypothetical protein
MIAVSSRLSSEQSRFGFPSWSSSWRCSLVWRTPSSWLELIHRALGLAHLTQPDQALKSVITISTMDVLHCLITSEMTAVPTGE